MARRIPTKKKSQFVLPPPPPIPTNTQWIESDSYDRAAYHKLRDESPSLRSLEENGGALVPRFDATARPFLFAVQIQHLSEEQEVLPRAALNRVLAALHLESCRNCRDSLFGRRQGRGSRPSARRRALRLLKSENRSRRDLLDFGTCRSRRSVKTRLPKRTMQGN